MRCRLQLDLLEWLLKSSLMTSLKHTSSSLETDSRISALLEYHSCLRSPLNIIHVYVHHFRPFMSSCTAWISDRNMEVKGDSFPTSLRYHRWRRLQTLCQLFYLETGTHRAYNKIEFDHTDRFFPNSHTVNTHVLQGVSTRITNTLATSTLSSECRPRHDTTWIHLLSSVFIPLCVRSKKHLCREVVLTILHYNTELNTT
jgi:hypothetical protein